VAEGVPGARRVIFENAGHALAVDAHEDLLGFIRSSLA
jgi:pimeloyl-ACP methyl ester carboxylesterase